MKVRGRGKGREEGEEGMRLRGNVLDTELDHRFGPDFESNFGSILLRKSKMCDQKIVFFFRLRRAISHERSKNVSKSAAGEKFLAAVAQPCFLIARGQTSILK